MFEVLVLTFEPTRNRSNGDLPIPVGEEICQFYSDSRAQQKRSKKRLARFEIGARRRV
jgi:hypothetical protein